MNKILKRNVKVLDIEQKEVDSEGSQHLKGSHAIR